MLQFIRWQDHAAVTLLILKWRGCKNEMLLRCYDKPRWFVLTCCLFTFDKTRMHVGLVSSMSVWAWKQKSEGVFLHQGSLAPRRSLPQKPEVWLYRSCNWIEWIWHRSWTFLYIFRSASFLIYIRSTYCTCIFFLSWFITSCLWLQAGFLLRSQRD